MKRPESENRKSSGARREPATATASGSASTALRRGENGLVLVTSRRVAAVLGVSLRTVERMVHDGEIEPVRLRGRLVRFWLEDVMEVVRNEERKWGRTARLLAGGNPKSDQSKSEHLAVGHHPRSEVRSPNGDRTRRKEAQGAQKA